MPNFAQIANPLFDLLKKNKQWKWESFHDLAFTQLQEAVMQDILLTHPDFSMPFYLQTDGSICGIAAHLWQNINDEKRTVAYASRSLKIHEKFYLISELNA